MLQFPACPSVTSFLPYGVWIKKKKAISRKDFIFLFLAGAAETGTALKVLLNLNIKHNRFS